MEVTKISVSFQAIVATGNYQNVQIMTTWEASLAPTDDPNEATRLLYENIKQEVGEMIRPIAAKKFNIGNSILAGLSPDWQKKILSEFGAATTLTALGMNPQETNLIVDEQAADHMQHEIKE